MNKETFSLHRRYLDKNLWQSSEWAEFQKSLGKKILFLGDSEASAVGIIQELPFGLQYLEIPRGPIGITDKNFWKQVKEAVQKYNCIFTRISPEKRMQHLPKFHFTSPDQVHPQDTLILDLSLSEEDLLKQMKPKGRYNIRVAQRERVQVFESTDTDAFYALLKETTQRDGFSGHGKAYYQNMLENLGDKVKLYLASIETDDGEEIIAGGIFTFFDNTCTYYYGASANDYREKMAPYLIQWTAISEACEKGFKYYDFLGIAPEKVKRHSLTGVTRFKQQFGGERKTYPAAQDIVERPFYYLLYRAYKFLRKVW